MLLRLNVSEAKALVTRLIARVVPSRGERGPRSPGGWEGRVTMADDFENLPEELAAAFRGERP